MKKTTIMEYDDWVIFCYKDNPHRYFVEDREDNFISEVKLAHKIPLKSYKQDIIDFGGSYDGESFDGEWALSFNLVEE